MKARSFRLIVLPLAVLSVLGLLVVAFGKPAYRQFKDIRARGLAADGERLIERGEPDEGWHKILAAHAMAPTHPAVLRTVLGILTPAGHPNALEYWLTLESTTSLTFREKADFIAYCIQIRRFDIARTRLATLAQAHPNEARVHILKSALALPGRRYPEAIAHARVAAELGNDPDAQLILAEALLYGSLEEQNEGFSILVSEIMAHSNMAVRAAQLIFLLRDVAPISPEQSDLIGRLLSYQTEAPIARLLSVIFRSRAGMVPFRERFESSLEEAAVHSPAERVFIGNWLVTEGYPDLALRILPPEVARTNEPVLRLRLTALAKAGDWQGVESMLAATNLASDRVLREGFSAWRSMALNRPADATTHFGVATDAALAELRTRFRIELLGSIAESAGRPDLAIQAWQRVVHLPQFTPLAAQNLLRLQGDAPPLADRYPVLKALNAYAPNDDDVALEFSYHALILKQDLPAAARVADALFKKQPEHLPFRLNHALALCRNGEPEAGLDLIEATDIEWEQLPAKWQAVYAIVLSQSRHREAARNLANRIQLAQLKPEEARYLSEVVGR